MIDGRVGGGGRVLGEVVEGRGCGVLDAEVTALAAAAKGLPKSNFRVADYSDTISINSWHKVPLLAYFTRRRSSSKKLNRNTACVEGCCSPAFASIATTKRFPSGAGTTTVRRAYPESAF